MTGEASAGGLSADAALGAAFSLTGCCGVSATASVGMGATSFEAGIGCTVSSLDILKWYQTNPNVFIETAPQCTQFLFFYKETARRVNAEPFVECAKSYFESVLLVEVLRGAIHQA